MGLSHNKLTKLFFMCAIKYFFIYMHFMSNVFCVHFIHFGPTVNNQPPCPFEVLYISDAALPSTLC